MLAYIFSGQGAQKPGMGQSLCEVSSAANSVFERVSNALGEDMKELCFSADTEKLNQTIYTQPAVFTMDCAAFAALEEQGIQVEACAGFSLGEYAALVCAGVLSLENTAKLVQARAIAMSEVQVGGMMAVMGLEANEVEQICFDISEGYVTPVNYNCPGQIVVAGEQVALDALSVRLKADKKRGIPLKVSGAFHSKFMKPAADVLEKTLGKLSFQIPKMILVGNVTGQVIPSQTDWVDLLQKQCCSPVLWEQSIRCLIDQGVDQFIECGPGKVLTGLNKKICPSIPTYHVEDEASLKECIATLQ